MVRRSNNTHLLDTLLSQLHCRTIRTHSQVSKQVLSDGDTIALLLDGSQRDVANNATLCDTDNYGAGWQQPGGFAYGGDQQHVSAQQQQPPSGAPPGYQS